MASFLSIGIPLLAIILLVLVLRRDNRGPSSSSVPTLPRSELSRQVWKATRPARAARRIAADGQPKPKPKFAPPAPPAKVAPFRPPRARDRRGA